MSAHTHLSTKLNDIVVTHEDGFSKMVRDPPLASERAFIIATISVLPR